MPKEIVASSEPYGPEDAAEEIVTEVSWSRDAEHVQLATMLRNRSTGLGVELGGLGIDGGMYASLDRRGINDLIRKLRRARDQAFGRDE